MIFPTVVGKLNLEDFTFCKNFKSCVGANWIVVIEAEGTSISGERYDQTYAHLFSFQDEKIGDFRVSRHSFSRPRFMGQ